MKIGNFFESMFSISLLIFSYVFMNSIKALSSIGKHYPKIIYKNLSKWAKANVRSDNSLVLIRFIEIHDSLISSISGDSEINAFLEDFSCFCSAYLRDPQMELRCSILMFFLRLIEVNFLVFSRMQQFFWDFLNLRTIHCTEFDAESESNSAIY